MIGLVLWYNPEPGVGVVWCEDQGPLAFLGPEATMAKDMGALDCGDQLVVSVETRDGVRYVRDVFSVTKSARQADPREILSGYHQTRETERNLRVVA